MTPRSHRQIRRELEAELRDESNFPVTSAPADLLAKIRAEIPADLCAANSSEPAPAKRRITSGPAFRLAASVAVAVVGVALGYRALERSEERAPQADSGPETPVQRTKGARLETAPVDRSEVRTESQDGRLSLKGETKETRRVGDVSLGRNEELDAPLRVAGPAREVLQRSSQSEISAAPRAAAPAAPAQGRPVDESRLSSLSHLGGAASSAAPSPASASAAPVHLEEPSGLEARGTVGSERQRSAANTGQEASATEAVTLRGGRPLLDARNEIAKQIVTVDELERRTKTGEPLGSTSEVLKDRVAIGTAGGSRAPNEQAAGDMFFRPVDTNPFVDIADDRLSTFALDVDTGSWTLARSYLERGALPPREAIRVEEFVNAQSYDDPAPRRGDFTLVAEGAPSPFAPGENYRLVRFAVKAREIDARDRKSANLTFVIDVSGSMSQENRLGLVKRALGLLLDELRGDDRVALVVYGTEGRVLLRHTRYHEAIRAAIASLRPEGSTNVEEGLRLGYDLADEAWRRESINRVILCSDGVANVGATGPESILARIGEEARRGIELTTVGFGMGNYNDALMEQLADQGDGAYHYVDTLDEARRIFVENLTGTLQTVAKDAKVQVEFDARAVDRWRLLGYENRDVADRDFRNDAVDAGEIGVGHSAVALYEVRLKEGARPGQPLGTLHLRWKSRATKRVEEAALTLDVGDLEDSFRAASANLRTAAVAAELGEQLKRSFWAQEGSWSDLLRAAERLEPARGRADSGLADLVRRATRLADGGEIEPQTDRRNRERLEEE